MADNPTSELAALIDQQKLAGGFIVENFQDVEGRNLRGYQTYREPIGFAQRLRVHLRRAIDRQRMKRHDNDGQEFQHSFHFKSSVFHRRPGCRIGRLG